MVAQSQQGRISLSRNLNPRNATTLPDLQFQLGELVSRLEDYLNTKINVFLIESKGQNNKLPRPTLRKGDLVVDFSNTLGVATLQFWDGTKLITLSLSDFSGFVNLITQGIGSGTNPTLFLRSDGAGGWVLGTPSTTAFNDTAEINATMNIPGLSLVTANGQVADSSNTFHFNHVVGISMDAVLSGNIATLVVEGEVTNLSWGWTTNDKLFLNGTVLSTIPPTSGFSQMIAIARNNNVIFIRLQQPILI